MKDKKICCVGFDCGNSSIRTVLGTFNGETIDLEVISQVLIQLSASVNTITGIYSIFLIRCSRG